MEKGNKQNPYEKLWNEEYKAHKYTIKKKFRAKEDYQ